MTINFEKKSLSTSTLSDNGHSFETPIATSNVKRAGLRRFALLQFESVVTIFGVGIATKANVDKAEILC